MPLDLYPCAQSSRTDLGHCAYEPRTCPQCAGAYAACAECEAPDVCPGCRHRAVLAQIAAGEVGYADVPQASRAGQPAPAVAPAGALQPVSDQAAMLDAGGRAVYNPGESHNSPDSPALGAYAMASPVFLLVLPVGSQDMATMLEALAPVITGNGGMSGTRNGHLAAAPAGPPDLPTLPQHLRGTCALSRTPCPHGHTYRQTGLSLRYFGNHTCVECASQRKPRRTAASQEG